MIQFYGSQKRQKSSGHTRYMEMEHCMTWFKMQILHL